MTGQGRGLHPVTFVDDCDSVIAKYCRLLTSSENKVCIAGRRSDSFVNLFAFE